MRTKSWLKLPLRYLILTLVPVLLCGGCANGFRTSPRECLEQGPEVLVEIATGQSNCSPALAAWEREVARRCGWVEEEDFDE